MLGKIFRTRTFVLSATGIVLLASALLALPRMRPVQPDDLLAQHFAAEIENTPDEEVIVVIRKMAALDEQGIPPLVETLASERESVASAGRQVLGQKLTTWRTWKPKYASTRVAMVASELAKQSEHMGSEGKSHAADLAMKLLNWPIDNTVVDSTQLISDCETVFRAKQSVERPAIRVAMLPATDPTPIRVANAPEMLSPLDPSVMLPGGDLPHDPTPIVPFPPQLAPSSSIKQHAQEPRRLDVPTDLDSSQSGAPATLRQGLSNKLPRPLPKSDIEQQSFSTPLDPTSNDGGVSLKQQSDVQLMRQIHDEQETVSNAVLSELSRRGFSADQLQIARQVFHPDPAARLRAAEALPGLIQVAPLPWLKQLALDDDRQVRETAIAILSTARDPKTNWEHPYSSSYLPNGASRLMS